MERLALYYRTNPLGKLSLCATRPQGTRGGHTLTGDIRRQQFVSQLLDDRFDVWVYLPPGFSATDPWRYPTVYLHDGQNVFDEKTSAFGVEWGVDETAEGLILQGKMAPVVMVAVANTPDRIAHYTPFADPQHGGGKGPLYGRFLVEELRPWLLGQYPLSKDPTQTAIIGSSLGGLSSLYLGWTRPEVFGLVGALSPSLWWGGRKLITRIGGDETRKRPHKVWIDMGSEESSEDDNDNGVPDVIDDLRTLRSVLLAHGFRLGEDLFYREVEGGQHDEAAWCERIGDVLTTFFPPAYPSPVIPSISS